jgi:hypothetical protein
MRRIIAYCLLVASILFAGCAPRTPQSKNPATPSMNRKERTESYLKSLKVPINPHLPNVESESEVKLRTPQQVAKRAIVLYAVSAVGHGADNKRAVAWLKNEGLWESVSPKEKGLFESSNLQDQEKIDATWRAESLWTLLWALKKTDQLELPKEGVDLRLIQDIMPAPDTSCESFIAQATLRSPADILDALDLIYRIHWAVVEERLHNREPPGGFHESLVYERHYALNWLVRYAEKWDDITTDT